MDDSKSYWSVLRVSRDANIFGRLQFYFGSKKAHFGSKMCFFGLLGHIRAKISKVKVGKWMIVGCVGQFFESIRMKLFSEGSNFIFGSTKAHFWSKMCFIYFLVI